MTGQDAHVVTPQETALYDALTVGDHDTIETMREAADTADQAPPDPVPDGWLAPAEQYDVDYDNAWSHYQADHETPENQREILTVVDVQQENHDAMEGLG